MGLGETRDEGYKRRMPRGPHMPAKAYVGVEGTLCPARPKMSNGELQAPNDQDEDAFGRDRGLTPNRIVTEHEWRGCQQRPGPHEDRRELHQGLLDRSHCL